MMRIPDKILISGMLCPATIGVFEHEQKNKQNLSIDVEFLADVRGPAKTDSIKDAVDYDTVAQAVAAVCASQPFQLIETVAERIASHVLEGFPVSQVRVLVRKISPIPNPRAAFVSVEIVRPVSS